MDDSFYNVPTYSWKKPKFSESRVKKLDYLHVFYEKDHFEPKDLEKVFLKKKHTVPGPTQYETCSNWAKKSPHDYEQQRGKQYRHDRITETAALIKTAK